MRPSLHLVATRPPLAAGATVSAPLTLGLASMLGSLVFVTPPPFFPVMSRALGVSVPVLGQAMTAMLFIAAVLSLVTGPVADRQGLRRLLVIGAAAAAGSVFAFGVAPAAGFLVVAAVLGGIASATLPGLSIAVARTSLDGAEQQRAIAWITAGAAVSAIATVPLMALVADALGWRMAFITVAALAAGVTVTLAWFLPADRPLPDPCAGPRTLLAAYAPLLRHRPTLRVYAVTVLRSVSWFGMTGYFGAFMANELGLGAGWIGLAYMLSGTAYVVGSLTARRVLDRISPRMLLGTTNVGLAATIAVMYGGVRVAMGAIILVTLAGLLGALSNFGTITLLATEAPGGAGTVMTLNGALTNLGAAAGGAMGGALLATGGYPILAIGLVIFALSTVPLVVRAAPVTSVVPETA